MRSVARPKRAALLFAAALSAATLLGGPTAAQTCFTLQAELSYLQSHGGVGGSGDRARYERAFRDQANVIARTEIRARNAGCFGGGFFLFRRDVDPVCGTLIPKLREMQGNLAHLDQLRRQAGSGNSDRIRELQVMIARRGCEPWAGNSFQVRAPQDLYQPDSYSPYGTYRTLCVRTCDGYYFPISFSTSGDRLTEDAHTCEAMCPGTEAKLFYHHNPGGGPENMMAIDGQAYASLPTAFQYRTSINPSCTCRPEGGYSTVSTTTEPAAMVEDPTAPPPRPRPAPGEDPETLANRAGDFIPRPGAADAVAPGVASGPGNNSVRVVGPTYWGDTSQDDVLLTPVPN
jgi:hypothetical protein